MIGIFSSIRTICHKLMWFYRNAVLFYIIFVVTHGENLWSSGDTGTLTVNKMAMPIEVSAQMVSYSYFYWKKYDCNWVTKLCSRYYCNMSGIRPRLMSCHWSFDLRWVKISGHSEQLGPCGSTSHFVNNQHSKESKLGVCLVLEVLAKLMVGENSSWEFPKVGVRLILEVCLILETRWYIIRYRSLLLSREYTKRACSCSQ